MKKNSKIKFSGKLKSYMQWPVVMVLFLVLMNITVYFVNTKAGILVSCFTALYVIMVLVMLFHYKPNIMNEMIYFATQYGQVQKTLLEEMCIRDRSGSVPDPLAKVRPRGRRVAQKGQGDLEGPGRTVSGGTGESHRSQQLFTPPSAEPDGVCLCGAYGGSAGVPSRVYTEGSC